MRFQEGVEKSADHEPFLRVEITGESWDNGIMLNLPTMPRDDDVAKGQMAPDRRDDDNDDDEDHDDDDKGKEHVDNVGGLPGTHIQGTNANDGAADEQVTTKVEPVGAEESAATAATHEVDAGDVADSSDLRQQVS